MNVIWPTKSRGSFWNMESSTKTPRQNRVVLMRNWRKSACRVVSQEVGGRRLDCQVKLDVSHLKDCEFYFECNGNHGRF